MFTTKNTHPFVALLAATLFATQASAQSHEHPAALEAPASAERTFAAEEIFAYLSRHSVLGAPFRTAPPKRIGRRIRPKPVTAFSTP